jgi:hypothetical protein
MSILDSASLASPLSKKIRVEGHVAVSLKILFCKVAPVVLFVFGLLAVVEPCLLALSFGPG